MYKTADNFVKISMAEEISPRLGFRNSASNFFNSLNNKSVEHIEIDFKGVKFMSRSFAHEYLQKKNEINKTIVELNKPNEVDVMLKAVIKSIKEPNKVHIKVSDVITIS